MKAATLTLGCCLALLPAIAPTARAEESQKNEVEVVFNVQCGANGELDAREGTTVRLEVEDNDGNVTVLTYTFPRGSHARAITNYFADALRAKGFEVGGPRHQDGERRSSLTIKNVKKVRVGTSLNGKLPVTFVQPPTPTPTRPPQPTPPPVITGLLPRLPQPTPPPQPVPTGRRRQRPTTFPPHGPGSIQILVTQEDSSGGMGGSTSMKVTISVSAVQGSQEIVLKEEFEARTSATEITRRFHEKLVQAGFDMKPYHPGDTQLFFNKVSKLDGAYSSGSARTTFGWGETPIVIDDRKSAVNAYAAPRLGLTAGYLMLRPDLSELNGYFEWINDTWSGNIDRLRTLHGGSVEGSVHLGRHLGVGVGYRRFEGSASGRSEGGAFRTKIVVNGGRLLLMGTTIAMIERLDIEAAVGAGLYSGRYTESEESWEQTATDAAVGLDATIRVGRRLNEHWSVSGTAGYQDLRLDDFDLRWVSPGEPPVDLNLSGATFGLGVGYRM